MTSLQTRRIPFRFDESVPFQWNPTNPEFGLLANAVSVLAIGFEHYIVAAMKQAKRRVSDPGVAAELDAFMQQEALHAQAHRRHVDALARRHPVVTAALEEALARYDALVETETLDFHLAYIASLEATFTPTMKMMLNHRDVLFTPGDSRVASLFVWHFVEEIEHRSSALLIYDTVVGDTWYRLRASRRVRAHTKEVFFGIMKRFEELDPSILGVDARRRGSPFEQIPKLALARAGYRLLLSQLPFHRPAKQPLPAYADMWFEAYDRGEDMTRFEGVALGT